MELSKNAGTTESSPFNALTTMFYEPSKAFAMLDPRRHVWLPLALTIVSSCILTFWYFSMVDLAWMNEQAASKFSDPALREAASKGMPRGISQIMAVVGSMIMLPLIAAVIGVYLMLIGKLVSKEFSFVSGFSLAVWSSIPSLLALPLGAVQMLMSSNGQLTAGQLDPLSLNGLLFQYPMSNGFSGPLEALNVPVIWSIILMVIGFRMWAKVSNATALKVVLIPYAVIFAGWFGFAILMSKAA